MGKMQEQILRQYKKLKGSQSLRKMSEDTGIDSTRIFRIVHGSEMRLGEYEIFRAKILAENKGVGDFHELLDNSVKNLDIKFLNDVQDFIKRKLRLSSLTSLDGGSLKES